MFLVHIILFTLICLVSSGEECSLENYRNEDLKNENFKTEIDEETYLENTAYLEPRVVLITEGKKNLTRKFC